MTSEPRVIRTLWGRRALFTKIPSTYVPFLLPRSCTQVPSGRTSISAWRRDTVGSQTMSPELGADPQTMVPARATLCLPFESVKRTRGCVRGPGASTKPSSVVRPARSFAGVMLVPL